VVEVCQRGAIVGVEGYPGKTEAGEFSVIARELSLLGACQKNLPMMNWNNRNMLKDSEKRFS